MKKFIGLLAVAAMAATFSGCNSADRASAEGTEVKVAGCSGEKACSEGKTCSKAESCCNAEKSAMKTSGSCSEKSAMSTSGSCSEKSSCGDKSAATKQN